MADNMARRARNINPDYYYDGVKSSIEQLFPITYKDKTLSLSNVEFKQKELPTYDELYKYKLNKSTVTVPVTGTLTLSKDGKVIDSKKVRLANIPQFLMSDEQTLNHGTFLINGSDYIFPTQIRLAPGVYTHFKENGEVETHFNKRKGWTLRVYLDSATRRFMLFIGNHNINLYSILKALNAPDSAIEKAWGKDLFDINSHVNIQGEWKKFIDTIGLEGQGTQESKIKEWFSAMDVGSSNSLTLATSIGSAVPAEITPQTGGVTWQTLLASSERILDVLNGKSEADDRNDIKFKTIHNIATYAKERLALPEIKSAISKKYKMQMNKADKISDIHFSSIIGKPFNALFTGTSLASLASQNNPTTVYTNVSKATMMHEGGISSSYMVSPSARAVHPSHFGIYDPVFTPESEDIGVVHQLTDSVYIDKDTNKMYMKVIDVKTNKPILITVAEFSTSPIMLYDAKIKNGNVQAIQHGEIIEIPFSKIKYKTTPAGDLFAVTSKLIPFLDSTSALRAMMGSKMMTQAVPLIHREAPKVSNYSEDGESYDSIVGKDFSVSSPVSGKVTEITNNNIKIKTTNGKMVPVSIPHFLPLNGDSYLTSDPTVKVGDTVNKGDLIADSNSTKNGVLAIGTHLRTAYIPIDGNTFEDSTVISESASKKLTSGRLKILELEYDADTILNKAQFNSVFPSAISLENNNKLDKNGIIIKGSEVDYKDTIIAAFKKHIQTERDLKLRAFTKRNLIKFDNKSVAWPYTTKGTVIDVAILPREIRVFIYLEEPATIGDKITTRFGSKMLLSKIIPDDQMPKTKDGKPIELMFNPVSVINRTNPSLLLELAASKLKGYKPENFSNKNHMKEIQELSKQQNVPINETINYKGHVIKDVPVGENYIYKLEHIAADKISSRYKEGYDSNLTPISGGETGAKAMDLLTVYSLLAANATANLNEMGTVKSEKNDDYWHAIEFGLTPPPPHPSFATTKFEALLKNAGINLTKDGTKFRLTPITDHVTNQLSKGEILLPKIVFSDLSPEPNGLYDQKITGGINGKNWAHIELEEPIPNPILRPTLTKILGLTKDQYSGLLDHSYSIDGKTGAPAFKELLNNMKLDFEPIPKGSKLSLQELDAINRKNRFVAGLKETGTKPTDLLIKKIPVLPPVFRPIGILPGGKILHNDLTYLYRDILMRNDLLKRLPENIPDDMKQKLHGNLNQAVEALYGLADPVGNYFGLHKPKGVLDILASSPPDESFFRKKMLSKTQNLVGRSVIIPDPTFHPDELGVPEDIANSIFRPFVMRKLIQSGVSPLSASAAITKRTPVYKNALENVMKERTVLLNRAPSLHKWNVVAYKPRLVAGDAIITPPLTVAMYAGDYDGDAVTLHTPVSDAAVKESYRLLPSQAFYHAGKDSVWLTPTNEAALGIYKASKEGKTVNKSFKSFDDAYNAWKASDIQIDDKVTINGVHTSVGKMWLSKIIPDYDNRVLTKKAMQDVIKEQLTKDSEKGVNLVMELKKLGDEAAMHMPVTLQDIAPLSLKGIPDHFSDKEMTEYAQRVDSALKNKPGIIGDLANSGAIKGMNQLRQIIAGPIMVENNVGATFKYPMTTGYSVGLSLPQYWGSSYGARKGAVDRKIEVSEPGMLANELLALAQDYTVTEVDCHTQRGIIMPLDSSDILDYVPVKDVVVDGKTLVKRNQILTVGLLNSLKKKIAAIEVRTPMTCEAKEGVCSICNGPEGGAFLQVGDHVGIRNAQWMSEPATQLTLAAFHHQGVVGASTMNKGLNRIHNIFGMQKDFPGRSQVALESGKVTHVFKRPEGTTEININEKTYLLPPGENSLVKANQNVEKGTQLNEGMVSPLDIYATKGLLATRQFVANELQKTYKDSGINIRKRVFDTIAKAFTNRSIVVDPGDSGHFAGDFINTSVADNFNNTPITINTNEAVGRIDPNTKEQITTTPTTKKDKVSVLPKPIQYTPYLKSLESAAIAKEDWISRLAFRHLKNTLQNAVVRGWSSDLAGPNPIPRYAFNVDINRRRQG